MWERQEAAVCQAGGARPQADLPQRSTSSPSAAVLLSVLAGAGGRTTDRRRLGTETHQWRVAPAPCSCTHPFPCPDGKIWLLPNPALAAPPAHTGLGLWDTRSLVRAKSGCCSISFRGWSSPSAPSHCRRCWHYILIPSFVKPQRTDPSPRAASSNPLKTLVSTKTQQLESG